MRSDFTPISLPFANGSFLPTDIPPMTQEAAWTDLISVLEHLQSTCISALRQPAWATIYGQIVVALWPGGSVIDQEEGLNKANGNEEGELRIRDRFEDEDKE